MKIFVVTEMDEQAEQPTTGPLCAHRKSSKAAACKDRFNDKHSGSDHIGHYAIVVPLELED